MPKLKTKSGVKKRFKLTATGKVKRYHAFKRHILTKKATGRKRHLRKATLVSKGEAPHVRRMLLG
jgi:large subunit ribosomal protein L35